jgi:DNA-binding response OmpR family regulator
MLEPTPARVAILEDDPDLVEALSFFLHDQGFVVLACRPTLDAAHCLADLAPRLIILDVRMGALDGIDVFHQLRADPRTRTTPVIFFTATEQRVTTRLPDYQQLDAAFVVKPNIAQLAARIAQLLAASGGADQMP